MTMHFRAIPQVPTGVDPKTRQFLAAIKENFEILAGMRGDANVVAELLGYVPANKVDVARGAFDPVLLYAEHTAVETPAALGALVSWTTQINTGGGTFSSGVFTIPATGRYRVFVSLMLDGGQSDCGLSVKVNGTTKPRIIYCSGTGYPHGAGEQIFDLAAGDTVQLVSQFAKTWFGAAIPNGPGHWLIERIG